MDRSELIGKKFFRNHRKRRQNRESKARFGRSTERSGPRATQKSARSASHLRRRCSVKYRVWPAHQLDNFFCEGFRGVVQLTISWFGAARPCVWSGRLAREPVAEGFSDKDELRPRAQAREVPGLIAPEIPRLELAEHFHRDPRAL